MKRGCRVAAGCLYGRQFGVPTCKFSAIHDCNSQYCM